MSEEELTFPEYHGRAGIFLPTKKAGGATRKLINLPE
jgi:hypothetical protein